MNIIAKIKEKLSFFNKYNKKMRILFLTIILFLIIILYFFISKNVIKTTSTQNQIITTSKNDYSSYVETKLQNIIQNMLTVKTVSVFVMTNGSAVDNYLFENEKVNNNSQSNSNITEKNEIVYQKNGSTNQPVKISTSYPEITGVLIYINKIDAITKNNIQKAISTVLNIDISCIYILQEG